MVSRLEQLLPHAIGKYPLPRLGFGCEQLGAYEWGDVDVRAVEAAVSIAVERGVRLFDTADCYGRGASEERLGNLLAHTRDAVVIATKFGVRLDGSGKVKYDSSPAWAELALRASLKRLKCEYIDLYQVHYWDRVTPLEATFDKLEELRGSGVIRAYGITNHVPDVDKYSKRYPGFATISAAYSLIEREAEAAVAGIARTGISFLSHGSLAQGLLSGKYGPGHEFQPGDRRARVAYRNFHGDRFQRNIEIVKKLREEAESLGVTLAQLALAWILHRIAGSIPLIGIKSIGQLEEAVAALELALESRTLRKLDEITCTAT